MDAQLAIRATIDGAISDYPCCLNDSVALTNLRPNEVVRQERIDSRRETQVEPIRHDQPNEMNRVVDVHLSSNR